MADGVPIRFRRLGSWWDGPDEVDVVAIGKDTLYCGECKYRKKPIPKSDLASFTERAQRIQSARRLPDLRLFIWTKSALSPGAQTLAEEFGIHVVRPPQVVRDLKK